MLADQLKAHIVSFRTGKHEQPPLPPTAEELDGSLGYNKTLATFSSGSC
jgi:hypothetical protein